MRLTKRTAVGLTLALAATAPHPIPAQDQSAPDTTGSMFSAIIALGTGLAILRHGSDHDLNSDWDQKAYGDPFSPGEGVLCLPHPRQCFENSHISPQWTARIFGN